MSMSIDDEYCLYIQKINVDLDDSKIKRIIEFSFQIGKVLRIECVKKSEQYLSAFVYISHINWSSASTIELLLSIENSKSYKLVLWWMDDVYWIVRKKCMSSDIIQNLQKKIVYLQEIILKQQQTINTHSKWMKHMLRKDNFFYLSSDSDEEDEFVL
jgi:hypothetical protein